MWLGEEGVEGGEGGEGVEGVGEVRHLSVVHAHGNTSPLEVEDVEVHYWAAVLRLEFHRQLTGTRYDKVRRLVLVAVRVSGNKSS